MFSAPVAAAALFLFAPDRADARVEFVITHAGRAGEGEPLTVDLLLINGGDEEERVELPGRLSATVGGPEEKAIWLERAQDTPEGVTVPPGGFARIRYTGEDALAVAPDALIAIPLWQTERVALASDPGTRGSDGSPAEPVRAAALELRPRNAGARDGSVQSLDEDRANAFLDNFSAYEPSYIVFGTASDSEWRVQASFKYRVLGSGDREDDEYRWSDGLYLGFTQKLFWDIASDASFRDVNYLPEMFYRTRAMTVDPSVRLGVQAGIQHESNGRSGDVGRSANNIYLSPMARFDLGGGYSMSIEPRYTVLIGGRAGNPDIMDYRGHTSLGWQVGQDDGWRLSTLARLNFSTGKGAVQTELSYPLPRLLGGGPEFYLFGQVFAGYGESLLDYDRRMTRLRVGFAITR